MCKETLNETERSDLPPLSPWLVSGKLRFTGMVLKKIGDHALAEAIARHTLGDWGDVSDIDWEKNDRAVKDGGRVLSIYRTENGTAFGVITEADRSYTTVLLPDQF
jgi:hypothetical protein